VKEIPMKTAIRIVRWTKDTKGTEGEIASPENNAETADAENSNAEENKAESESASE